VDININLLKTKITIDIPPQDLQEDILSLYVVPWHSNVMNSLIILTREQSFETEKNTSFYALSHLGD